MNKIRLLVLLVILPFVGFGQMVHKKYKNREVIINKNDSIIRFNVLVGKPDFYPASHKVYYWYDAKEIKRNLGDFSGYLLHGDYEILDNQKFLIEKGSYYLGKKHGEWKKWNKKGGLLLVKNYKEGELNGEWIEYNTFGQKIKHDVYQDGVLLADRLSANDSIPEEKKSHAVERSREKKKFDIFKLFKSETWNPEEFDD